MCQHLMDNMQPREANIRQSGYPERPQYAFSAVVNPMHIITLKAKKPSWGILAAAKIKSISEKWFSHFLLLSILSGYALLGAVVFCVLEREGQPHSKPNDNSPKITRRDITLSLWRMRQAPLNESEWMEKVDGMLRGYEKSLNSPCKEDAIEWTIWSSLFYCGTVLTTIGIFDVLTLPLFDMSPKRFPVPPDRINPEYRGPSLKSRRTSGKSGSALDKLGNNLAGHLLVASAESNMKPHGISRSSLTINHIWNARGRRPTLRRTCKVFIPRDLRDLDMLRLPASYEEEHFVIQKLKTVTRHKHHHWILVAAISCYVYFGAIMFQYLEENHGAISPFNMTKPRERLVGSILNGSLGHKEYDETEWVVHIRRAVLSHEALVLDAASQGYKGDRRKGERPHWSIQQSILFCFTVITTVGYGNIAPSTDAGRAVTIVYAFLGIPLMLMVLADLGKLFTKAIKFVFRYVRRFYRTGTFNKIKAAAKLHSDKPLQYMTVSWRTVSQDAPVGQKSASSGSLDSSYNQVTSLTLHNDELYKHLDSVNDDEVNHKHIEVEDEFNLPVTLAVAMVLVYMMVGAMLFAIWEEWSFFEAFYFVFISMSTVGFGDYVPMHQTYMMGAFAYLVLGLTLTSMCINVIQEKLSATFQKAKVRIGSTMGLDVNSLLREDHSRSKSFRSKSPELKKANGCRSKLSIQKESTCGSPSRPSSPNPGLDGSGSCGLGKEFLLNVPLQNRFKFYDSPYSTIHDDSGSSPSLRKLP